MTTREQLRAKAAKKKAAKKKANSGSFKPGHDPRRHMFTYAERSKGFRGLKLAIKAGRVPQQVVVALWNKIKRESKGKKGIVSITGAGEVAPTELYEEIP